MKCLSLWNPWALLLVAGKKKVETRGWPIRHRGPLLIHAAKKWDPFLGEVCAAFPFRQALQSIGVPLTAEIGACMSGWGMPFGAVVGRVNVVACSPTEDCDEVLSEARLTEAGAIGINMAERLFGDYRPGRFAFLCEKPVRFKMPIPFRGEQGLFNVPDSLLKE